MFFYCDKKCNASSYFERSVKVGHVPTLFNTSLGSTWSPNMNFHPCSLQVNFNEPISMLQRLSEDLEYHELLDKASKCQSSLEQMCYVAAFSVSSYSTTVHRTGKPFNPLLGETYELDRRRESGYRSLCEQVRETEKQKDGGLLTRKWNWTKNECQEGWLEKSHWLSILSVSCFLFLMYFGCTCYRELAFMRGN